MKLSLIDGMQRLLQQRDVLIVEHKYALVSAISMCVWIAGRVCILRLTVKVKMR